MGGLSGLGGGGAGSGRGGAIERPSRTSSFADSVGSHSHSHSQGQGQAAQPAQGFPSPGFPSSHASPTQPRGAGAPGGPVSPAPSLGGMAQWLATPPSQPLEHAMAADAFPPLQVGADEPYLGPI